MTCTHVVPEPARNLRRNLIAGSEEKNVDLKFPSKLVKQCSTLKSDWGPTCDVVLLVFPPGPVSGLVGREDFGSGNSAVGTVSQKP